MDWLCNRCNNNDVGTRNGCRGVRSSNICRTSNHQQWSNRDNNGKECNCSDCSENTTEACNVHLLECARLNQERSMYARAGNGLEGKIIKEYRYQDAWRTIQGARTNNRC